MNALKSDGGLEAALSPFKQMAMFEGCLLTSPESACGDGDTPLHVAAMSKSMDHLLDLLPFVTNINVAGDIGNTPLHCAVAKCRLDIAQLLIEKGADVWRKNDYGDTPLSMMKSDPLFSEIARRFD